MSNYQIHTIASAPENLANSFRGDSGKADPSDCSRFSTISCVPVIAVSFFRSRLGAADDAVARQSSVDVCRLLYLNPHLSKHWGGLLTLRVFSGL